MTQYYIATDGNDSNDGSIGSPFATIGAAYALVEPGDTINFRGGNYGYDEMLISGNWSKSGTSGNPITIQGYEDEEVFITSAEKLTWSEDELYGGCYSAVIPDESPLLNYSEDDHNSICAIVEGGDFALFTRGSIATFSIVAGQGGSGYSLGDTLRVYDANGRAGDAVVEVTGVDVTAVTAAVLHVDGLNRDGYYLSGGNGFSTTSSGGGSGCKIHVDTVEPLTFTDPTSISPFTDGSDNLKYNITWYDSENKTLYFKSNELAPVTDLDNNLHVVSPGVQALHFYTADTNYITINKLHCHYGYNGIHIGTGGGGADTHHWTIQNCSFKWLRQGLLIVLSDSIIENNFVDRISGPFKWRWEYSYYQRWWLFHCLYHGGFNNTIRGNFFGRSTGGSGMQFSYGSILPYGLLMHDNVCYGQSSSALLVTNTDDDDTPTSISNQVSINRVELPTADWNEQGSCTGLSLYPSTSAVNVYNSYFESAHPVWSQLAVTPALVERFNLHHNVFNKPQTYGGTKSVEAYSLYFANNVLFDETAMDNNIWMGTVGEVSTDRHNFVFHISNDGSAQSNQIEETAFADFRTAVQALETPIPNPVDTYCEDWEVNSQGTDVTSLFDFDAFDAYLDGTPTLAGALAWCRDYAVAVQALLPRSDVGYHFNGGIIMAATWETAITVVNRDQKRISVLATRTDGEDVRTFGLRAVFIPENETFAEFKTRVAVDLNQSYLDVVAMEDAVAAIVVTAEADITAALEAMEI